MTRSYYADPRPDIQAVIASRGARVLDVGCGAGELAVALKRAGAAHVAGIELEPQAAASARAVVDLLAEGDVLTCHLPFREREFDYLIFADVLEHLTDPDRALERCLPYLKPDGTVIVSVPNIRFYSVLLRLLVDRWSYTDAGVRDRTHLRIFTRRSLERMIAEHGLEIEQLTRKFRLFEDQSQIGRLGVLGTRIARATVAPVFRDLMAYQYLVVAHRRR